MGQDVEVSAKGVGAVPCNIANGATLSDAVDLEGFELVGIWIPANFQGTTIGFQTAEKPDGTFQVVRNTTGDISLTCAPSRVLVLPTTDTLPFLRFLKLVVSAQNANIRLFLIRKQGA